MEKIVDVYNMTNDSGFAPCPDNDLCSLATCMVRIRKNVGELWFELDNPQKELEYWIVGRVGTGLSNIRKNRLIYFMKVEDVLSFDRYHRRYKGRTDDLYYYKTSCECTDDNCIHRLNYRNYKQIKRVSGHNAKKDIDEGRYVLLSKDYCYFNYQHPYKNEIDLEKWEIDELKWKANGTDGPFYRKYNFDETEEIIEKIKEIRMNYPKRYTYIFKNNDKLHDKCFSKKMKC